MPRIGRRSAAAILGLFLTLGALGKASPATAASPYTPLVLHINATTTITLVLVQDASPACPLANTGTDWAALDFGSATKTAATSACATYGPGNTYTLQTTFSVKVTCSGTCTTFNLSANLASAAQTNITWRYDTTNLTTTSTAILANQAYNTNISENFRLSVKTNGATPPNQVMQAIVFTATANGVAGVTATATLNAEEINEPGMSMFFVKDPSGAAVAGGAFAAAIDFGTVSAYGAVPAGVTLASVTGANYTLTTPIDVNVEIGGFASANYTMQAALAAAAPTGITYTVDGVTLTTTNQTVNATGTYSSDVPYTLGIVVLSAAPGAGGPAVGSLISSTIDFTATAN